MGTLTSVDRYLASLPGGLEAYRECTHKGVPLGVWLRRSPIAGLAELVPSKVGDLLRAPGDLPPWVPEVHANVIYLAMREARFADDAAFLAHASECNRAVLDTPANRVLFWAASPRAILRGAEVRWRSLHLGTKIDVRFPSAVSADVELTFPPNLMPEIVLRGNAVAAAVALENAGARDVEIDLRAVDATRGAFFCRWR